MYTALIEYVSGHLKGILQLQCQNLHAVCALSFPYTRDTLNSSFSMNRVTCCALHSMGAVVSLYHPMREVSSTFFCCQEKLSVPKPPVQCCFVLHIQRTACSPRWCFRFNPPYRYSGVSRTHASSRTAQATSSYQAFRVHARFLSRVRMNEFIVDQHQVYSIKLYSPSLGTAHHPSHLPPIERRDQQ